MTRILAIDASTEACSVALYNKGEITERYQVAPRQHANLLLPQIEDLLSDSCLPLGQVDAIACNIGPGAFTGIRIAVSVAQGLAFGADLPAISLSSLCNLAYTGAQVKPELTHWITAIDARMDEVYFAAYHISNDGENCIHREEVVKPEEIDWQNIRSALQNQTVGLIGSGWHAYAEIMLEKYMLGESVLVENTFPRASAAFPQAIRLFSKGEVSSAEALQPSYLRNQVAEKKKV